MEKAQRSQRNCERSKTIQSNSEVRMCNHNGWESAPNATKQHDASCTDTTPAWQSVRLFVNGYHFGTPAWKSLRSFMSRFPSTIVVWPSVSVPMVCLIHRMTAQLRGRSIHKSWFHSGLHLICIMSLGCACCGRSQVEGVSLGLLCVHYIPSEHLE